jgi:Universal stress protein family
MTYRIVVGVDGSEHSSAALRWALSEAECHSGTVTAVLAWQVPFLSFPGAFDRDELEKAYKEFLIETVSGIAPWWPKATRPSRWSRRPRARICWSSASAAALRSPGCSSAR